MAWILRLVLDARTASSDLASALMWDAGTTGVFEEPAGGQLGEPAGPTIVAGFETEQAGLHGAKLAREHLGDSLLSHSVAPYRFDGSSQETSIVVPGLSHPIEVVSGTLFGHGSHPTTELALELLASRVTSDSRVLDVGCGTGVLALAAKLLGASAVSAIEIDPAAADVVPANLVRNGLSPDAVDLRIGSAENLTDLLEPATRFDIVVANVLLPVHQTIAPHLAPLLAPGASVITSGTLTGDDLELDRLYRKFLPPGASTAREARVSTSDAVAWSACVFALEGSR